MHFRCVSWLRVMLQGAAIIALTVAFGCHEGGETPDPAVDSVSHDGSFSDCSICPAMVAVPGKKGFLMGASPEEAVTLKSLHQSLILPEQSVDVAAFAIGQTEVTVEQFNAFLNSTGGKPRHGCWKFVRSLLIGWTASANADFLHPGFEVTTQHPAGCISWEDAQAYVEWLSKVTGKAYRLPTTAEWEYVARAASKRHSYLTDSDLDSPLMCDFENISDKGSRTGRVKAYSCSDGYTEATAPVKTFEPSPFGLYDVLGNVSEWVVECINAEGQFVLPSDRNGGECKFRTAKGGSYVTGQESGIASFERFWPRDSKPFNDLGFRVAR